MFEVIWSVFADAFFVRKIEGLSRVRAKCTGTLAECIKWIARNK